jgi:hypothetical protein
MTAAEKSHHPLEIPLPSGMAEKIIAFFTLRHSV